MLAGMPMQRAQAVSATLVINEIDYDQPSIDTAEFIELKNVSASTINLDNYTLELVNGNAGGAVLYATIDLPNVNLAAGDYYVICANAATVANCDLDSSPNTDFIQNGSPDGSGIRLSGTLQDAVSYEGNTGAPYTEGSGVGLEDSSSIAGLSISRCADGADTDVNNVDLGLRNSTPGVTNDCPLPPVSMALVINEIDYDQPDTDTAEFIEFKNVSASTINLDNYTLELVNGNAGGAVIYQTIDLPNVNLVSGDYYVICANIATVANCDLDVSPDTNLIQNGAPDGSGVRLSGVLQDAVSYEGNTGSPYTEGSGVGLEDTAAGFESISRCQDGSDTNVNNVDFLLRTSTPGVTNNCPPPPPPPGVCGDAATFIHDIQGTGLASPDTGSIRVIEGIVVGDYQSSPSGFGGFHLQEEDAQADADQLTSEGIFVFDNLFGVNVNVGDIVRVRGTVGESSNLTRLASVDSVQICSSGNSVAASSVTLPVSNLSDWERYEGMLINITDTLTATENFTLGRFGEVALSVNGRLLNPTMVTTPGASAIALQDLNNRSRILLDDGNNQQNIDPTIYPTGGLSAANTLRSGYTVNGLTGVLEQRFGVYRVQPIGGVTFNPTNPRPTAPDPVIGRVRVAAMNVLNYFTTLNQSGNVCGPSNLECRGANTASEFTRQRNKILPAMLGLDADVIGLMELENNATAAIQDLVDGLNAATAPGTYAFINTGTIGTDAIKVGLIYRTTKVTPVGAHAILDSTDDPSFIDTLNRPVLAQTFEENQTGERFTVAVNHLKSKGSVCNAVGDPDTGDGQGNCNVTRTNAAIAEANWLAGDPTGSGDPDFLLIGDFNAYLKEDPITALQAEGYTNLIDSFVGADAYSFVFQGQSGYLDHALASSSLTSQVAGATEWHVNADEPIVLDYNTEFKSPNHVNTLYAPNAYRSSDHDPLIVGLFQYDFTGFFQPVDNLPVFNTVKAGQAVPVKFSLNGDQGLNIFAAGYPKSEVLACNSTDPVDGVEETVTAGGSSLSYDPVTDTYTYIWKTDKAWANSCRQLVVKLNDGTVHRANFNFTK